MKHLFPLCLLTIVACSSPSGEEEVVGTTSEDVAPQNFLSDDEVLDGWDLLFDGSSLNGWHMYGGSATEGSGSESGLFPVWVPDEYRWLSD